MNTVDIGDVKHEIVIVRRNHGDHDDGHHGGVWKIAFADFMTAMMCFFLVMWLINAADEHTKAAVANYFNPVKLIDQKSSQKGLENAGDGASAIGPDPDQSTDIGGVDGNGTAGPTNEDNSSASLNAIERSDQQLFADPYAVLAEIAANSGVRQNVSDRGDGGVQEAGPATGASGGDSYRDPFAPDFWSQQVATPLAEASAERSKTGANTANDASPTKASELKTPQDIAPLQMAEAEKAQQSAAADMPRAPQDGRPTPANESKAEELTQKLNAALGANDKLHDGISVTATASGVTISITDQLDFGMFEIGSAVPRHELVLAMEKIGKVLSEQKGNIVISGHTDARPFRGEAYDNWRLSTARAHSAYYMLVRGGLDEQRITEVSGFAERQLKDTSQPLAAVNRRIEIRLEQPQ